MANSERHHETDVPHIEHWGMHDQPRVLQQRVQIATVRGWRNESVERVRGQHHEQQETNADESHYPDYAGAEVLRKLAARHGHSGAPSAEHQHPKQQRAFMGAPDG